MVLVFKNTCAIDLENGCAYMFMGLSDDLAATVLANTNCPSDRLPIEKSEEGFYQMSYCISIDKDKSENEIYKYIDTIGDHIYDVANSYDSLEDFCENCLLKGMPADIHNLMRDKFGLIDESIEWYVAHFFIQLGNLLYAPKFLWTSIREDIENGEMCFTLNSNGEVHDITSVEEYNKIMEYGNDEEG